MTRWLLVMADRLRELSVTRVVMEATSDYWKGIFYLLEAHGFETWLVNARDVKHLPGRPKTDPPVAGRDPLPRRSGRGPDRGEAAGGEAAGGRPDQAVGGRQRHLRGV